MRIFAFDHGGTLEIPLSALDENYTIVPIAPKPDDLVLERDPKTKVPTVIRDGKQILPRLHKLTTENPDCLLAFHSKNKLEEQLQVLRQIKENSRSVPVPHFSFIPVYDQSKYPEVSSDNPVILYLDRNHNLIDTLPERADINEYSLVAAWGKDDLDGKASVRKALEKAAEHYRTLKDEIGALDKANSYIFDDGLTIPDCAIAEGWKGVLVSESGVDAPKNSLSLLNAVKLAQGELVQFQTSKKQNVLTALHNLKELLTSKNGLDIAILRMGRIKLPGMKSGCEHAENLDGYVTLSTLKLLDIINEHGMIQPNQAKECGVTVSKDLQSNLRLLLTEEQIRQLTDEEKLIIDAIVYDTMGALINPELEFARHNNPQGFASFPSGEELIKDAFSTLNFELLLKNKAQFIDDIQKRIETVEKNTETIIQSTYPKVDLPIIESPDYDAVMNAINIQIEEYKTILAATQNDLPALQEEINKFIKIMHSKAFLENQISQEELLNYAQTVLELYNKNKSHHPLLTNNMQGKLHSALKSLETLYSDLVITALYKAVEEPTAKPVQQVISELGITSAVGTAGRVTFYNLIDNMKALGHSIFAYSVDLKNTHLAQKTYQLASIMVTLVDSEDLKSGFNEAKDQLFLATVRQRIRDTTLSEEGWKTWSRYQITIDDKTYRVPRRIYEQYTAIERFMNDQTQSATQIADEVMKIGQQDSSSRFFGPNQTTKNYFSVFKGSTNQLRSENEVQESFSLNTR